MNIISPPAMPPASKFVDDAGTRSEWSFGRFFSRAILILVGIAVGCFIGVIIGLVNGWIDIQIGC